MNTDPGCFIGTDAQGNYLDWDPRVNKDLLIAGDIGTEKSLLALAVAYEAAVENDATRVYVADANSTHAKLYEPLLDHLDGAVYGYEAVTDLLEKLATVDDETIVILEGTHAMTRGRDPWRTIPALSGAVANPHVHLVVVAVQIYELSSILRPDTARVVMGVSLRRNHQMVKDTLGRTALPVCPFDYSVPSALLAVGGRFTWIAVNQMTSEQIDDSMHAMAQP